MSQEGGADAAPQDDPDTHGTAAGSGDPPPPPSPAIAGPEEANTGPTPSAGAGSAPTSSAVPSGTFSLDDVQVLMSAAVATATQEANQQMRRTYEARQAAERAAGAEEVAHVKFALQQLQVQVAQQQREAQQRASDTPEAQGIKYHEAAKALADRYGSKLLAKVLQGARPSSLKREHDIVKSYNEELVGVWKSLLPENAVGRDDHDYWFRALERTFGNLYLAAIQLSMTTDLGGEGALAECSARLGREAGTGARGHRGHLTLFPGRRGREHGDREHNRRARAALSAGPEQPAGTGPAIQRNVAQRCSAEHREGEMGPAVGGWLPQRSV